MYSHTHPIGSVSLENLTNTHTLTSDHLNRIKFYRSRRPGLGRRKRYVIGLRKTHHHLLREGYLLTTPPKPRKRGGAPRDLGAYKKKRLAPHFLVGHQVRIIHLLYLCEPEKMEGKIYGQEEGDSQASHTHVIWIARIWVACVSNNDPEGGQVLLMCHPRAWLLTRWVPTGRGLWGSWRTRVKEILLKLGFPSQKKPCGGVPKELTRQIVDTNHTKCNNKDSILAKEASLCM